VRCVAACRRLTGKLLLLSCACIAAVPFAEAALTAGVDRREISETDTVELTVRSTADSDDVPDWSGLTDDFDILATRSASQIVRGITGNLQKSSRTWVLRLKPRRTGELSIPSLVLAGERSRGLSVTVHPLDPAVRRAIGELVFFEVEHSPDPVYVQGQLLVTRRLFYADGAQLYGEMPESPRIADGVVHPLGDPRAYTDTRNGRRYGVLEQRYAIFPERSGKLIVPAAAVGGSVRVAMRPGAIPSRTGVQVSSEVLEVDVLPIPPGYPTDAPWLPASEVEIVEAWGEVPPKLTVGKPITRTLIVRTEGNQSSVAPPLDFGDVPLKVYPEPVNQNDTSTARGLVGTRTETVTLVATEPGVVTLPAVDVTWWDTDAERTRIASVPARRFDVAPAAGQNVAAGTLPEPSTAPLDGDVSDVAPAPAAPPAPPSPGPRPWLLWLLLATTLVSTAGWLSSGWRSRSRSRRGEERPDHGSLESRLFRELRGACRSGDAQSIRSAFTAWRRERRRVPGASDPLADDELRTLVDELSAHLYAPGAQRTYEGARLLSRVEALRRKRRDHEAAPDPLPPLYPGKA